MDKKITSPEDIKNLKAKEGEKVEFPGFDENTPFVARVKRPSLMELCKNGTIPNPLLIAAQKCFEGQLDKASILDYGGVFKKVAEVALVDPKYSEVEDLLTDDQLVLIFDYTQKGVVALLPFRDDQRRLRQNELADTMLAKVVASGKDKKPDPLKAVKNK